MPVLTGTARRCYERVFGTDCYTTACRMHDYDELNVDGDVRFDRAHFSPRHDAESCFWVIMHFLLMALPTGMDPADDDTHDAECLRKALETHKIGSYLDNREYTFCVRNASWSRFLHRSLQSFGPLVESLVSVVQPVYEFCEPEPPEHHLHEAMQRILLQEICRVLDEDANIALDPQRRRALNSLYAALPGFTDFSAASIHSKKRSANDDDEAGSSIGYLPFA